MHQIRVQCASHGHPLLGDQLYGASVPFGPPAIDARERLIALHARRLEFNHPMTNVPLAVEAPLTPWWEQLGVRIDS
jgi:23S rRNA-/tRNA-specific pseudouridylate synthase